MVTAALTARSRTPAHTVQSSSAHPCAAVECAAACAPDVRKPKVAQSGWLAYGVRKGWHVHSAASLSMGLMAWDGNSATAWKGTQRQHGREVLWLVALLQTLRGERSIRLGLPPRCQLRANYRKGVGVAGWRQGIRREKRYGPTDGGSGVH